MRCTQCGSGIQHDPVWSHGMVFCSTDCAEESALVTGHDYAEDEPGTGVDRLLSMADEEEM